MKAAIMMLAPMTVNYMLALHLAVSGTRLILTIKLVDIVRNGLHGCASAGSPYEMTLLLGLALVEFEDQSERYEDENLDDAEKGNSPSPRRV
jgi:hypothetical protein